jgi:hypothetical protein
MTEEEFAIERLYLQATVLMEKENSKHVSDGALTEKQKHHLRKWITFSVYEDVVSRGGSLNKATVSFHKGDTPRSVRIRISSPVTNADQAGITIYPTIDQDPPLISPTLAR